MHFFGPCEVCGKVLRSSRSLSNHLRVQSDQKHFDFKQRIRTVYQKRLKCRKCGGYFDITSDKYRYRKRCDRCVELFEKLGKSAYENLDLITNSCSFPQSANSPVEGVSNDLYSAVVSSHEEGETVQNTLHRLGVSNLALMGTVPECMLGRLLLEQRI